MKYLTFVFLVFCFSFVAVAEVSQEPQKFQVIYTVTYNSLTLEQAAEKEALIKGRNKEGCKVDIEVKEQGNFSGTITFLDN